jgi:ACR3 family arsenite efflux pump ArsB
MCWSPTQWRCPRDGHGEQAVARRGGTVVHTGPVLGLAAGRMIPGLGRALDAVQVAGISLPIAVGLLAMMYPVLAKVRYDRLDTVTRTGGC